MRGSGDVDFWRGWPYPVAVAALVRRRPAPRRREPTRSAGRRGEGDAAQPARAADGQTGFARVQQVVARWGAPVVAAVVPHRRIQTLVNLAAGVMRMPLRRYIPALVVGSIIWAFLYATVGFATFAAWRRLYELSPVAAIVGLMVLLAGLAGYIVWQVRHRDDSSDEREPASLGA